MGETSEAIDCLHEDVWYHIIHYLELDDISHFAQTSRSFNDLCCSDILWKRLLREIFPHSNISSTTNTRYKRAFKKLYNSKSQVVFDLKPWDGEVNWPSVERIIRDEIVMKGVVWGSAQRRPIAYGIEKLQILCQYKDELLTLENIEEQLELHLSEHAQTWDVFSFTKLK